MPYQIAVAFTADDEPIRLTGPAEPGIHRRRGRRLEAWQPLSGQRLRQVLADSRPVPYEVLLCPRDDLASPSARVLDKAVGPPAQAAARVGWPVPPPSPGDTVQDVIDRRSNDYTDIDRARQLIGDDLSAEDTVSVVIPARNSQSSIGAVVAHVARAATAAGVTWECLVVDDASDEPLTVDDHAGHVRVIRSSRRRYAAGARNLGMDHARYDTILFCDSDTLLPADYLARHLPVHRVSPYTVSMSMRDGGDERVRTTFGPDWVGLDRVEEPVEASTLRETDDWRAFGWGRRVGPVALQFVVWSHNLCVSARTAKAVRFPDDYVGWGLEDNAFGAAAIVYGCFVLPVLSTSVRHLSHAPRSGSPQRQEDEFRANLMRYLAGLRGPVGSPW
jgi:GT2 family glycosyltransferase